MDNFELIVYVMKKKIEINLLDKESI